MTSEKVLHNKVQQEYFAENFKQTMQPVVSRYIIRQLDHFIRISGISRGQKILEVGCGIGRYTLPLLERGFSVEGLDLTPELLEQMRDHAPEGTDPILHAADIIEFPSQTSTKYDATIGFFAAHHFHDLTACFQAMAEVTKPGGTIAFLEPNGLNPLYYLQIALTPRMTWSGDKGVKDMRRRPMFKAMSAAGLTDLTLETFGFLPPFVTNSPIGPSLEPLLEGLPGVKPFRPFQVFRGTVGS